MMRPSQVLTVEQMRAAEQALMERGESVESLIDRAGKAAAEWVWRLAAGRSVTVLCGPGNNGGDGYVIAQELLERGAEVTVVALGEPKSPAATAARDRYTGPMAAAGRGGVLVDCLFGIGLTRALEEAQAAVLRDLAAHHAFLIAVDVPSGIDADSGQALNDDLPRYDVTLALGALKPAHALMPAMAAMGAVRLIPIGVEAIGSAARLLGRPRLSEPAADAHKYTRGLVTIVEGPLTGAALLACQGAMHAGAGAVRLWTERLHPALPPDVVLGTKPLTEMLQDKRIGAVVAGPGLGLDDTARTRLRDVLASGRPCVIDADALRLIDRDALAQVNVPLILTPHAGEMEGLANCFALSSRSKVAQACELAQATRAVVVSKGPDTVIAAPDGRLAFIPSPTSWLSVGGSGDVLAGIAGARLAWLGDPFDAAGEAVWLHGEAGRLSGPAFLASELAGRIPEAYAACQ